MNARTMARLLTALALVLVASALMSGCAQKKAAPANPMPVSTPTLKSGKMPGLEFVDVGALPMGEKANIDGWQAGGASVADGPALKPGTYKSVTSSAFLDHAETVLGSSNGIAQTGVKFTFTEPGSGALASFTAGHGGDGELAIVLNGKVLAVLDAKNIDPSAPVTFMGDPEAVDALAKAIVPGV